ncbi:hypothetical protein EVAR_28982_1 [Eumeta japonica]|uniref:Uncharacterized protein n=1 Tax=Eumeta variegata TaxID=151549 RepID=A0A4C1W4Y4_EUMVA|nr:hypothetical protein EVAR_28982_1 [Eumeta japonica]
MSFQLLFSTLVFRLYSEPLVLRLYSKHEFPCLTAKVSVQLVVENRCPVRIPISPPLAANFSRPCARTCTRGTFRRESDKSFYAGIKYNFRDINEGEETPSRPDSRKYCTKANVCAVLHK